MQTHTFPVSMFLSTFKEHSVDLFQAKISLTVTGIVFGLDHLATLVEMRKAGNDPVFQTQFRETCARDMCEQHGRI
jgi:hypothetical protein